MSTIAVFASYRDYTNRPVMVTAGDERVAAARLKMILDAYGATAIRGPFDYRTDGEGVGHYTPREWPAEVAQ